MYLIDKYSLTFPVDKQPPPPPQQKILVKVDFSN